MGCHSHTKPSSLSGLRNFLEVVILYSLPTYTGLMTHEAVHYITVNRSKRSRCQIRDLERVRDDFELVPQSAPPALVRGHGQRVVSICKKKQSFIFFFSQRAHVFSSQAKHYTISNGDRCKRRNTVARSLQIVLKRPVVLAIHGALQK